MVGMGLLFGNRRLRSASGVELVPISGEQWLLAQDDLLFGRRSLTLAGAGRCSIVKYQDRSLTFESSLIRVRLDAELAVPDFYFYFFESSPGRQLMSTIVEQTAVAGIRSSDLRRLTVPIPPLDEQRCIAEVLGALDDLIEADRRMATECSDLAQSMWDEFMEGCSPNRSLASLATIVLGGTPARHTPEFWDGDIPWLNSGKANDFRVTQASELITQLGLDKSSTKMMPIGTTIVAITGATLGQVSRMEIAACGNQSLVGVYAADVAINDYLYFAIRDQIDVLVRSATGGAQQHINKANVEELLVKWPSDERILAWHSAAEPLMKATADLLREAEELEKTRDELLPLLMSGAVRVRPEGIAA